MSTNTSIEWATKTWGVVLGCKRVSAGCDNCYAIRTAHRLAHNPNQKIGPLYAGLTDRTEDGLDWTGVVRTVPERLGDPLKWRKPERIFVNSQSDLFHPAVPAEFIAQVFAVMAMASQHTFQILTKRPVRMRTLLSSPEFAQAVRKEIRWQGEEADSRWLDHELIWPLPNVHLGVSVEDQHWADIRIPALLETPAEVRWISAEPLLGSIRLCKCWTGPGAFEGPQEDCWIHGRRSLNWVVVGGESGPGARPMHPDWARSLRDQCAAAGVPYLFKQWGAWRPEPIYATTDRFHVVMPDGRDRGTPWSGWGIDQPDAVVMERVGKGKSGRLLDGVEHNGYPAAAA